MIEWHKKGHLDFSQVKTINLDEYKGLSPYNEQGYWYFMNQNFFSGINISMKNTHVPNGAETDSEKVCSAYNAIIRELGGIDLQLLGIGHDGHIGFNEPGTVFEAETHCVNLPPPLTIEANKRFFEKAEDVPAKPTPWESKTSYWPAKSSS